MRANLLIKLKTYSISLKRIRNLKSMNIYACKYAIKFASFIRDRIVVHKDYGFSLTLLSRFLKH